MLYIFTFFILCYLITYNEVLNLFLNIIEILFYNNNFNIFSKTTSKFI